jgi:hypothetical protein
MEPIVYEKVRSEATRKCKNAPDAEDQVSNKVHVDGEAETGWESIVNGEEEGHASKKRRLNNLKAGNEVEVDDSAIASGSNRISC